MTLGVLRADEHGVELDTGGQRRQLSSALAANVTIVPLADEAARRLALRRLSALAIGQQATVESIAPACRGMERRRLLDLGLVPGTRVVAEFASPAGDPVAYRVRGALIALRTQQADMIHIQPDTQ
jgi:DtxR family Mn-dependent transcriptional regulator